MIFSTGTFDFSRADLIATAPSWGAEREANEPLNYTQYQYVSTAVIWLYWIITFATGVRAALRIYASWISFATVRDVLNARWGRWAAWRARRLVALEACMVGYLKFLKKKQWKRSQGPVRMENVQERLKGQKVIKDGVVVDVGSDEVLL